MTLQLIRDRDPSPSSEAPGRQAPDWTHTADLLQPGPGKRQISLRLDADVLDFFKQGGRGYQSRINAVLRAYMLNRREGG